MSDARVAFVIVSHSKKLAEGVVEIATQMAPSVHMIPAGGRDDGGIGTSFDLVSAACEKAQKASGGAGVVVLTDLGSATMVAESVIEFSDDPDLFVLLDSAVVESAVVGAVASEQRAPLKQVVATIMDANKDGTERVTVGTGEAGPEDSQAETAEAVIEDQSGLHARPAAEFVKMASVFDADIRIDGADAKSLMDVMALGRRQGDKVTLTATGPQAAVAVRNLADALSKGFDQSP